MLVVTTPPGREAERRYVFDVVLSDWLGLDWTHRQGMPGEPVRISLGSDSEGAGIAIPDHLFGQFGTRWLQASSLPTQPLHWVTVPSGWLPPGAGEHIPVLYGSSVAPSVVTESAGGLDLEIDVFGSVFFMITRYEEIVSQERDKYERFPARAAIVVRERIENLPLADIYTELLWSAIVRQWPSMRRRSRSYRVLVTHDVDYPLSALDRNPIHLLRSLGADVLKRHDAELARRRLRAHLDPKGSKSFDPWNTFPFILDTSEGLGLTSTFNFLADHSGPTDGQYQLEDPWIIDLMGDIRRRGHEIGLHGGYESHTSEEQVRAEFAGLVAAYRMACPDGVDQPRWGGRQHFLRWQNPSTWRVWDAAGLDYDSSVGFAETIGFRCGTSHEFRVFDLNAMRSLALRERPLLVMDTSMFLYERAGFERASDMTLAIAREVRRYDGTFVGLWHNNNLASAQARRWYSGLLAELV